MRLTRLRSVRALLGVAILAVVLTDVGVVAVGRDSDSPPEVTCPGADGRSRELRRCLEDSFAFVETPIGSGSGVLLTSGHIVTNAHVVDPFERVDVTFPGGEEHEGVRVVGVDAFADIAVLEHIDTDRLGLTIAPTPDLDEDEEPEVLLVGYPGGVEGDDPRVTLASGILSRIREVDEFDATYLQTDAAISGGQSGGALVDNDGQLLGISGLGFAEEFALALSADDVLEAIDAILAGDGDDRRTVPSLDDAGSDPTTVDFALPESSAVALLPADASERTIRVRVTADRPVAIDVSTFLGEPVGANQASLDLYEELFGEDVGSDFGFELPLLDEVEPGVYEFEAPDDEDIVVSLTFRDGRPGQVTFDADVPFVVYTDIGPPEAMELGDTVDAVVDGFTWEDVYTVELTEGQEVEITVRSPASDPYYILLGPDEEYSVDLLPSGDDGAGGLYDLDAQDTHRIDRTGTYRIVVGTYDGIVAGYHLSVLNAPD